MLKAQPNVDICQRTAPYRRGVFVPKMVGLGEKVGAAALLRAAPSENYGISITLASGRIRLHGKIAQHVEEFLGLADEKSHVGQKLDNPHGNAFRLRGTND
jgi:hypothetical protein